ncbi:hypothetical protein HPB47_026935 [Ixodes persulcatus]|uniref:Uncharacterized protein n=1 Tax=Ixodes persulcatus TaxID=34615 RepID=A0AC60PXF2_IXOPE|nr:hypothetical protein HPB47_026935 [Ixodes persulcatus]
MVNITLYLLFTPSQFTPETLEAYKSLEAYNYFVSGHVQDVRLWQPDGHDTCFVRANVRPSQRATGPPQDAWVCLDNSSGQEDMVPVHKLDLSKPGMPSRRLPDEPNHVAHDYNPDDRALFREILRLNPKAVVLRELSFALCVRWHNQPSSDPANVLANKEPPVS